MNKKELNTIEVAKSNFKKKLLSFKKSLQSFKEIYSSYLEEPNQKVSQMALIKSFEITFELSWKTLQSFLKSQGYIEENSPKGVIKSAFNKDIIENGQLWIDMLDSRNRLSHVYDESLLNEVIQKISRNYLEEIEKLYKKLEEKD